MKLSTKTLASLVLMTAVAAAVPGITQQGKWKRRESRFDRILHHHDRKGELRAEILNMDPNTFRMLEKKLSMDEIVRRGGFKNVRAFRFALLGKLKNELHLRGWSPQRIEHHVVARSQRIDSIS